MSFTEEVVEIIKAIPKGRVATYGQVARLAGNPRAARQVVRTLNTQTKKHKLPWHRMINAQGKIAIKDPFGADEQKALLLAEGVEVSEKYTISLEKYQWKS
ncbi:MAG: MGMT family protein [Candidatus Heimdallarchaeota archaeon]|nr:MGMT family protein [Candidatus Heimdallarchaeota archaeon]MCK5050063.1 MGMT family protein [Candidatus Heimdallarchaeota archaeon]